MIERIGSYKIDGLLGAGGMGEVYAAFDEKLERRVALKLIRAQSSGDPKARERFRREARLAARLRHPCIIQIYHVEDWEGYDCIVMELVEGENLAEILRRGPLDLARALPLLQQISEALAYAHAQGVIHRDLKTQNVMITAQGQARILDFGLAKDLVGGGALSKEGTILGTYHAMSPEQAEGRRDLVDHRTDLFSLGVLFYEVLTGVSPFLGANPRESLSKVLAYRQPSIRDLRPEVPSELVRLVDRLLEKDLEARLATAGEAAALIERIAATFGTEELTSRTQKAFDLHASTQALGPFSPSSPDQGSNRLPAAKKAGIALTAAALIAAVFFIGSKLSFSPDDASTTREAMEERSIAEIEKGDVVVVWNISTEDCAAQDAWLGLAVEEGFRQAFRMLDDRVVDSSFVEQVERSLAASSKTSEELLNIFDADLLIAGVCRCVGDLLQLEVRRADLEGNVVSVSSPTSSRRAIPVMIAEVLGDLQSSRGLDPPNARRELAIISIFPDDAEALRLAFSGIASLRARRPEEGAETLRHAASLAEHPFIDAAAAEASARAGDFEAAEEAIRRSLASDLLAPERFKRLEVKRHQLFFEWKEALKPLYDLRQLLPDDLELGLETARTQLEAGLNREAAATLEELREDFGNQNLRLLMLSSRAFHRIGDYARARDSANDALDLAEKTGLSTWEAAARLSLALTETAQGNWDRSRELIEQAQEIYALERDEVGSARAVETAAFFYYQTGRLGISQNFYEKSVEGYRELNDDLGAARSLMGLSNIAADSAESETAMTLYREAKELFLRYGDSYSISAAELNLGTILHVGGALEEAKELYQRAFEGFERIGDREGIAAALTNLGEISYLRGRLGAAKEFHEEALTLNLEIGIPEGAAYDEMRLGWVARARGDDEVARRRWQEALGILERIGDGAGAAEVSLAIAQLNFGEGNLQEAERGARSAEEILLDSGWIGQAASARVLLARLHLRRDEFEEALEELAAAEELAGAAGDPLLDWEIALVRARLDSRSSRIDEAVVGLEEVVEQAERAGITAPAFEARLELGRLEMKTSSPGGRTRLEKLAAEARAADFGGVVERVAALLKASAVD